MTATKAATSKNPYFVIVYGFWIGNTNILINEVENVSVFKAHKTHFSLFILDINIKKIN